MMEMDSAVSYITDALRIITENTANLSGGRYITAAFTYAGQDKYDYSSSVCAENGEEIIERIRGKLRD